MDELESIEAELKECLQELDNGEVLSAGNDGGADVKEAVNGMKTEIRAGEGERKRETVSEGRSTFQPDGSRESEKVLQWREAFKKRVQRRDAEEEKAKAIWRKKAEEDLEEFYKRQANTIKKFTGRTKEEADRTESSSRRDGATGNIWTRVVELCEFGTKARSTKDVSRMRSVILALSEPPTDASPAPAPQ